METLGSMTFHTVAVMAVMPFIWLFMGKRQIGELSPFDFAISITAGTVAGAGIADPRIELSRTIVALMLLGMLQVVVSWLGIKLRTFLRMMNAAPTVLVEEGRIIKGNLAKVRVPVETLLQMLREKEVFNITEVEIAILEPQGTLSVLKKAEHRPLTPQQLSVPVAPNRILVPVILEGRLQVRLLRRLGFSDCEIEEFQQKYRHHLGDVFVAFMDKECHLHVVGDHKEETGVFLH